MEKTIEIEIREWLLVAAGFSLCCFLIGFLMGEDIEQHRSSYCSTCNKIYFDDSNRCDECGTEYIKYEDEKK